MMEIFFSFSGGFSSSLLIYFAHSTFFNHVKWVVGGGMHSFCSSIFTWYTVRTQRGTFRIQQPLAIIYMNIGWEPVNCEMETWETNFP